LGRNKPSLEGLEALLDLKDIFLAHFMLLDDRVDPIPHFCFSCFSRFYIFSDFSLLHRHGLGCFVSTWVMGRVLYIYIYVFSI
jgi:hypothetical protein